MTALRMRTPSNKYGRKKTEVDGIMFDSMGEAALYNDLRLLERAGQIKIEELQPIVRLTKYVKMKPDFKIRFFDSNTEAFIEFKGFPTKDWVVKKNLWRTHGPNALHIYCKKGSRIILKEIIEPERNSA